ncbi:MAG: tRNA (adenosine(37)-N6)-threonylcarbamoyltransferase complex ATPase subunit type 1 TsaE, partial [Akkermansia sp.]|nr:tRNA (adenosine(37)-N6)-threonylcarbamoyltransferase complex ATPase subunit type 1 TsaE [Akkermansia sp.]
THLTQGIMEGLGSSEAAASPTFSLVHEHADGRLPACHFDFYRLKDESELTGIGWEEYLDGETVLIVEWANLFPEALPEETSWLLLEHEGSCLRRVSLAPAE